MIDTRDPENLPAILSGSADAELLKIRLRQIYTRGREPKVTDAGI